MAGIFEVEDSTWTAGSSKREDNSRGGKQKEWLMVLMGLKILCEKCRKLSIKSTLK